MGGTRLRIGRQSPFSSPRSRPPSSAPRERCGSQTPARAWAVRSAPPREVPATKSQGLRGGAPWAPGIGVPAAFSRRAPGRRPLTRKEKLGLLLYGGALAVSLWGVGAALRWGGVEGVAGRGCYSLVRAMGLRVSSGAWGEDLAGHPRKGAASPHGMKTGVWSGSKEGNLAFHLFL